MSYRYSRCRGAWAALGVGAVLAAAAHGASKPVHAHTLAASMTTSPASGYSPGAWAHSLLAAADLPATRCNRAAIEAWETAEGGAWQNSAQDNPLNTTMPEPGSWLVNGDGVRGYVSWASGLRATVATLGNGDYPSVVAALENGQNAQAVANAVADSPWGTNRFEASCS